MLWKDVILIAAAVVQELEDIYIWLDNFTQLLQEYQTTGESKKKTINHVKGYQ